MSDCSVLVVSAGVKTQYVPQHDYAVFSLFGSTVWQRCAVSANGAVPRRPVTSVSPLFQCTVLTSVSPLFQCTVLKACSEECIIGTKINTAA